MSIPTLQQLDQLTQSFGETDQKYLRHHYGRFAATKLEFDATWPRLSRDEVVLDIGAHWLHQSLFYALDGYRVIAADLPATMAVDSVIQLAAAHNIQLVCYRSLEQPAQDFSAIVTDSVSVVLFTEILEHITFNPVAMWKEVYRVLRPGGRIIITTPNYYAWRGRAWDSPRLRTRFGGGISTSEILLTPTYGHHWKEYSVREVIHYFCMLSPDFNTVKAKYVEEYFDGYMAEPRTRLSNWLERRFGIFRPNMHVEIEIREKRAGIVLNPAF